MRLESLRIIEGDEVIYDGPSNLSGGRRVAPLVKDHRAEQHVGIQQHVGTAGQKISTKTDWKTLVGNTS